MMSPDLQRIQHIKEYCVAIGKTIERYGNSFEIYAADEDFQRSVSFSILQIGEPVSYTHLTLPPILRV